MRVRLSAHAVIAIAIVVSCGGGQGGSLAGDGAGDGPSTVNPGGYDTPPSDFDRPPGQDTPPSDYDNPSPGSGSGSDTPGNPRCASFCRAVMAEGCPTDFPDVGSCTLSCSEDTMADPCGDEILDLLICMVNSPDFTCDLQGQFEECTAQALAYSACQDGGEGGQGGI